ncbi:GNAT family N-acetyltransferase [Bacillus sp. NPDC077027]|uniref:GNAT family N-acetyltransferase n=1 Tax=Bacillus sp. NPDC077027 TaxID=3390548 RepID=UPI003D056260
MKVIHAIDEQVLMEWVSRYTEPSEEFTSFSQFGLVSGAELKAVLLYEWSQWESGLYGQHIFHVKFLEAETDATLKELMERFMNWMRSEKCDFFFLRLDASDMSKNRIVQQLAHVYYVGGLTRLEAPPKIYDIEQHDELKIESPDESDKEIAASLANQAFMKSRYALDPFLNQADVQRFYQAWMRNNLNGRADINLVAKLDDEVLGLIQGKTNGKEMALELLSIRPDVQGRGLGKKLLAAIMEVSYQRQHCFVSAGTQMHNIKAIQLYEKMGFRTTKSYLYYHVWPKKGER